MKTKLISLMTFFSFALCAAQVQGAITGLLEVEKRLTEVYQQTHSSVVNVSNVQEYKDFFLGGTSKQERGSGSGFIWDQEGHIITNFHVVQGDGEGGSYMVSFPKVKDAVEAKVVGVDPKLDIAVLKVKKLPASVKPLAVGSSQTLTVGQIAIAIGHPFGLGQTMTSGIISAQNVSMPGPGGVQISMIQTDAAINPGNSGGPLLNSLGELIGVNSMIYSPTGASAGLGFAIPVDHIKPVIADLIKYGKVMRPTLGIIPLDPRYLNYLAPSETGVMVMQIPDESFAAKAGLQGMRRNSRGQIYLGDMITKIEKDPIKDVNDIFTALSKYKIGDEVQITFKRYDPKSEKMVVKTTRLKLSGS